MAGVRAILGPAGGMVHRDYKVDATVIAGAFAVRSTATNSAGEVVDGTTTGAADAVGIYMEAVTYRAAPTTALPEGVARIIDHPLALVEWAASGGAGNVALALTAPANRLVNELADTTNLIVTDDVVGTVSFAGGLLYGRTGANRGQVRRIITHNNNVDTRVEVAFLNNIAVGDTFLRVPWSKAVQTVQLTTTLDQADAIIVAGTGAPLLVWDIEFTRDAVLILTIWRDHHLNPLG